MLAAAGVACLAGHGAAYAQDAAPPAASTKPHKSRAQKVTPAAEPDAASTAKDPGAAARLYTEGVKAYQAGRLAEAIQQFSGALSGGLANNLVPKALYYRGSSYTQMHEPGLAISDFNSALYFKDGLDADERAEARKRRSAAYRDAGLAEPAESTVAQPAATPQAATVSTPAGTSGGIGNFFGGLFGGSSSAPAESKPKAEPAPAAEPQTQIQSSPAFGGLFSPPHKVIEPVGDNNAEVLPWGKATETAAAPAAPPPPPAPPVTAAAAPAPEAAAPAPPQRAIHVRKPPVAKGRFRIQVASVPTRDEASSVIATLQGKGGTLASAPVSVDSQTFGTKTFYRVRLGPYATVAETKAPCAALKSAGLDCLVTAQ